MIENIEKDLIKIYKYFGAESQDSKFFEECNELLNAYDCGKKKDIIEEKADVFILAVQHYLMIPEVRKVVDEKIKRVFDRIESNYYEVEQ